MRLKTGDRILYKNNIVTVLEHTSDKLIILIGKVEDLNEIEIKIEEITI